MDRWYVATLILQCRVGETEEETWTVDEQIRVIRATDAENAYMKALAIGRDAEHSYTNAYSEVVRWQFLGLADLEELLGGEIRDGTEIRSRLFESNEPHLLVKDEENFLVSRAA